MTSWEWLIMTIQWTAPWTVILTAVAILVVASAWGSWRLSKLWHRAHIKDELGEIAQAEIEKRDALIEELRDRLHRAIVAIEDLRVVVRGAHAALSGAIYASEEGGTRP